MDSWFDRSVVPPTRYEVHYSGSRMVRCFTDRPKSVHSMLASAVARRPEAVALICGDEFDQLCRAGRADREGRRWSERRLASRKATESPW